MEQISKKVTEGFVAEFDGKFWGVQYADGHVTSYGFGPIEKATIVQNTSLGPVGMTYSGSRDTAELAKAEFTKIRKVETFERVPEPLVISPTLRKSIETAIKMKLRLKGCDYDPRYDIEVKDILRYFVDNQIETLVVNYTFGNYDAFGPQETVTLDWFLRNHLWTYQAPPALFNTAQADDECIQLLLATGLFEVTLDTQTRYDPKRGRPDHHLPQRTWSVPVKCLRLKDIEEETPVNDTPTPVDLEEPEDGLSLDEQLHLESQHEDNESIRATEEAEARLRGED